MSGTAIGIMDGAFFVGRKEIVDWINSTLQLGILKIEDTASGAIACQLTDIMYPDAKVPMSKVNWSANKDFEYVNNYKILQGAFTKIGVDKYVDVDRLISGRYMDNLEFMQWFKKFFETHVSSVPETYDMLGQRNKGKGGSAYFPVSRVAAIASSVSGAAKKPAAAPTAAAAAPKIATGTGRTGSAPSSTHMNTEGGSHGAMSSARSNAGNNGNGNGNGASPMKTAAGSKLMTKPAPSLNVFKTQMPTTDNNAMQAQLDSFKAQNDFLNRSLADCKVENEGLVKERDFYLDKLREIEIMLQEAEDNGRSNEFSTSIFKILYATADGFEVANPDKQDPQFQSGKENHMPIGEDFESF